MAKTDTKELLRTRFAELRAERDAVEAKLAPLNAELKRLRAASSKAEADILVQKKPLGARLSDIDMELASVNSGLTKRRHNGHAIGSIKD